MSDLPQRKRPARFDLLDKRGRSNIVFVTVCLQDRRPLLNCTEAHEALVNAWQNADAWLVGKYMIMPDHIHFFCAPATDPPVALRHWVAYWKRLSTQGIRAAGFEIQWMRDCWDRQVRNGGSYTEKWDYVCRNPERAGLVEDATDWPYQGEMHPLRWRDAD